MKAVALSGICALALAAPAPEAAEIYRCTDQSGRVTLTSLGCPTEQEAEKTQAINRTPGSGLAIPLAKPRHKTRAPREEITVVGRAR